MDMLERKELRAEEIREAIINGYCPFCMAGPFHSVAAHTALKHGIKAYDLREMAGLQKTAVIVSEELHRKISQERKNALCNNPNRREQIISALELGRSAVRSSSWERPVSRENLLKARNSLEHKDRFKKLMQSIDRSAIARKRTPEAINKQTERIIKAYKKWAEGMTKEELSKKRKEIIENMPDESRRKMLEGAKKGGKRAGEVMRAKLSDPQALAAHKEKCRKAKRHTAKVPREHYEEIKIRAANGETHESIARNYNCSRSLISRIVRGEKD